MHPRPEKPLARLPAFTAIPNRLLDEVMPTLKDTEWRLLCVICRQTLGWQSRSGNSRKVRDWMSQKQLIARTGRNSEALSRALDVLVKRELVECCDSQEQLLTTSQQRRNYRGRTYYSLAPHILAGPDGETTSAHAALSEHKNPQEEESPLWLQSPSLQNIRGEQGWSAAGAVVKGRMQQQKHRHASKSEVRKANGTKETENKRKL